MTIVVGIDPAESNEAVIALAARLHQLIRADIVLATVRPPTIAPAEGDYRLVSPGRFAGLAAVIPSFGWSDAPGSTPAGTASNSVIKDRDGDVRRVGDPPGAYVS